MRFIPALAIALLPLAAAAQTDETGTEAELPQVEAQDSAPATPDAPEPTSQRVGAGDPEALAAALQALGYRALLTTDDYGDPKIRSGASGAVFDIWFYGCEEGTDCKDLQFYGGFETERPFTAEEMNAWNLDQLVGQAYIDENGDPRISLALPGATDMTPAAFERLVLRWDTAFGTFVDFIDY